MIFQENIERKFREFFRAVDVADDLTNITEVDVKKEVSASDAELTQDAVDNIWASVENFYRTGMSPGVTFCLRKNGKIVLNRALGHARGVNADEGLDEAVPLSLGTPVCLYSASKSIMAMMVHKLAEEGYVNLLDPVAHYIPEFGQCGKENISIYQMLSHRGGFPMVDADVPMEVLFDREQVLKIIYETEAICPDGRVQAYHAVTSGFIADELVRVTTGKTIQQYLKEKVADPMGMKYFTFGLNSRNQKKVALNYVTGMRNGKLIEGVLSKAFGVSIDTATELSNSQSFMEAIVPSANLYATAEEVSRFYQMMLNGGKYKGKTIFEPVTIQKATREVSGFKIDKTIFLPARFSPGFLLGGKNVGMYGLHTDQAYGHLGFSNIFCWADPERDISVAFLTTGKPIVGNHLLALPKMINTISEQCS